MILTKKASENGGFFIYNNLSKALNINCFSICSSSSFLHSLTHSRVWVYGVQDLVRRGLQFTGHHRFSDHIGHIHTDHVTTQ